MREEHNASIELNNKSTVNTDVTIANDPNDPENRIYVFVGGIPIAEVRDVELDGVQTNCHTSRRQRHNIDRPF